MTKFLAPPPPPGLTPGPRPTFSVVIPVYNAATTVRAAVESALGQTVAPVEVLVVDDGSTDGSEDALRPYLPEIVLIHKDNGGAASAFNAGLRAACGDFISVLDADDAYEPERIEMISDLGARRPDLDLLATDVYLELGGEIVGQFSSQTPFAVDDQRVHIFDRCFVGWPAVRRDRLAAVGGHDETLRIAHDWDCYLRLILSGAKAGLVDAPLYRYRLSADSLTGNRPAALRERVTMLEKATTNPNLRPEEQTPLRRAITANRRRALLAEAEAALRRGDRDARRRALAVALGRGIGARSRARASLAALAPRWAGRRLALREANTGRSRLHRSYPR